MRFTFSVASFDFDMPAGDRRADVGTNRPDRHGQLAAERRAERAFFDGLGDGFDGHRVGGELGGGRKAFDADAGRGAVDLEVEVLDFADREALEADRDRQLHFDEPFVRCVLEPFGGRDVAIFDQPREIEAHVLSQSPSVPTLPTAASASDERQATENAVADQRVEKRVVISSSSVETTTVALRVRLGSLLKKPPGRCASKSRCERPRVAAPGDFCYAP